MTIPEFFASVQTLFAGTDKRLAAIETQHGAALEVERGLRVKAETSLADSQAEHAKITVQALGLQAELDKLKTDHAAEMVAERAKLAAESGQKAANIVAGAGFKTEVPAEGSTHDPKEKRDLWVQYGNLPIGKRHEFYRKNRAAMLE